jgi:hypothetical protein
LIRLGVVFDLDKRDKTGDVFFKRVRSRARNYLAARQKDIVSYLGIPESWMTWFQAENQSEMRVHALCFLICIQFNFQSLIFG